VSWHDSSARDVDQLSAWQAENGDPGWGERRTRALRLLTDADRIESIAQLVGAESLPGQERITLRTARLLREAVLQQSAVLENDQFTAPGKQRALLVLVLEIHERLTALLERGVSAAELEAADLSGALRARYETPPDGATQVEQIGRQLMQTLDAIGGSPG
jgi:V/A-type H+-transporting ATPase subunit A